MRLGWYERVGWEWARAVVLMRLGWFERVGWEWAGAIGLLVRMGSD